MGDLPQPDLVVAPLPAPLTALVGREQDLAHMAVVLRRPETRLVTVTGPGGVGKTRLALETARMLGGEFDDGVAFIPLAAVSDPELVPQALADAIGERNRPDAVGLRRALGRRQLLLVLDNFEQVTAAAAAVAELLGRCPGVKALVTSRERLRVRGEWEYPLLPLSVGRGVAEARSRGRDDALVDLPPAVALFVERVTEVRPEFALRPDVAATAVAICRRLDGLPLAIELAAARAKVLPLPALLTRLERCLPLLTDGPRDQPARQQTLERTIAWSYDLLSEVEQAIFRRLSVFVGGFTLDAAAAVVWGEGDENGLDFPSVLDWIASLVDKSLVRREERYAGEARFVFLETVREFGLGRLAERSETEAIRGRHARWLLDLVETTWDAPWDGPVGRSRLDRFEDELGNLRAALDWLIETDDATAALTMIGLLSPFWIMRSYRTEGRTWSERGLAMPGVAVCPPGIRARAYHGTASLARTQGDLERALDLTARCHDLYLSLDDRPGIAASVNLLGALERGRGNLRMAAAHFTAAEAIFTAVEGSSWLALARCNLGVVRMWQGDLAEASRLLDLALTDYRARDDAFGIAFTLHGLAFVAGEGGDLAAAARYLAEDLARSREFGSKEILIDALFGCGVVAANAGEWVAAATILGAAEAQAFEIGYTVELPESDRYDRAGKAARAALEPSDWAEAQATGRALALRDAADVADRLLAAIIERETVGTARGAFAARGPLSPREAEVVQLLAEGLSDRQIGEALSISHRTVMRHVASILAKLEVPSRGAAGAWCLRRGR